MCELCGGDWGQSDGRVQAFVLRIQTPPSSTWMRNLPIFTGYGAFHAQRYFEFDTGEWTHVKSQSANQTAEVTSGQRIMFQGLNM